MRVLLLDRENAGEGPILEAIRSVNKHADTTTVSNVAKMRQAVLADQFDALIIRINDVADRPAGETPLINDVLEFLDSESPRVLVVLLFTETPRIEVTDHLVGISRPLCLPAINSRSQSINVIDAANIETLTTLLRNYRDVLVNIDSVEINTGAECVVLKADHVRILKIFSKRFKGASCRLTPVNEGMSGAEVIKLVVTDENGGERIHAIAKLGTAEAVQEESERFRSEVTRLLPRAYAPQVSIVESGAKVNAGVFYRLLSEGHRPIFELLEDDPNRAAESVRKLANLLEPWHHGCLHKRMQIREIRQRVVSDNKLGRILENHELGWIYDLENKEVQVRLPCLHGDLHGANVFVDNNDDPIMIDFGDVGEGPAAFDPVTLELSIFTHPSFYKIAKWHPDPGLEWANLARYIDGSPYATFIRACRIWAHEVSDDLAVYACAYAYLLRQLDYTDVDSDLMLGLLDSVVESINNAL